MGWKKPISFFVACISMPKVPTGVKRPRDTNQLAKRMVDILTGEVDDSEPTPEEQGKDPAAVARGKTGGVIGGRARAMQMTEGQRSEAARLAAEARWRRKTP
jgi:hypothetical protein